MSDERARGIILRVRPLSDTSLIVHWITSEHGRIATVAKGARRSSSPFLGRLDLGYCADLSFARARRSSLHTLREVSVTSTNPGVRADYTKLLQFSYGVSLLECSTETDTPIPDLYALWAEWLGHLDRSPARPRNIYALETRLLVIQGFDPLASAGQMPEAARNLFGQLRDLSWDLLPSIAGSSAAVRTIRTFLGSRLEEALGKIPEDRNRLMGSL